MQADCSCGRDDGWHLSGCRALGGVASLEYRTDGSHWVYRSREK